MINHKLSLGQVKCVLIDPPDETPRESIGLRASSS